MKLFYRTFVGAVLVFLLLPVLMVVVTSFSSSPVLVFPPSGFTLRWYENISPDYFESLRVSLIVGIGTSALATVIGTPAALAIVRGRFPGKALVSILCLSPLMVSTLVIGVALFQYTIALWDIFHVSLGGSIAALIVGQASFTIPFVIRAAIAGQAHFDRSVEEASINLGATPLQTFFRITLPILMPGIASGAIFAFLMSFDDVAVALFVGGGATTTLPVRIYTSVEFSLDASVMAIGALVICGSLVCVLVLDRLVGADKLFGTVRV